MRSILIYECANKELKKYKKNLEIFLRPGKNKNRKIGHFFGIVRSSFRAHFMATPFDEFRQKLVWKEFKGKIRECLERFFITAIVFFFFGNFQKLVNFRKFEKAKMVLFTLKQKSMGKT